MTSVKDKSPKMVRNDKLPPIPPKDSNLDGYILNDV